MFIKKIKSKAQKELEELIRRTIEAERKEEWETEERRLAGKIGLVNEEV